MLSETLHFANSISLHNMQEITLYNLFTIIIYIYQNINDGFRTKKILVKDDPNRDKKSCRRATHRRQRPLFLHLLIHSKVAARARSNCHGDFRVRRL